MFELIRFFCRNKTNKFVIVTAPRTGSNFLIGRLNVNPAILCHYEIFHDKQIYLGFKDKGIEFSSDFSNMDVRDRNHIKFLSRIISYNPASAKYIGFKIFIKPMHSKIALKHVLKNRNIKKILLKRKNLMRSYVSLLIAQKTNLWSSKMIKQVRTGNEEPNSVNVDFQEFLKYSNELTDLFKNVEETIIKTDQKFLTIYYEDLIKDQNLNLNAVSDFFLIPHFDYTAKESKFKRQNLRNLSQMISNYEEFTLKVKGTKFERFLQESSELSDK